MVKKKKLSVAGCQLPVKRMAQVLLLLLAAGHWQLGTAWAQQAQAQQGQPLYAVNAKYVQGVGPGYWPTAGAGLTLNIAAGTAICGNPPVKVDYAGGTLTMTNAATNYVYLDPTASCVPAKNTSGFIVGMIPLAQVVAAGGAITGVTDVRTWFVDPNSSGPVIRADLMPGADAGAQIIAAIAALPSTTGGTVDARRLEGGTISTNPFAGITKSVRLLLGSGTYTTTTLTMPVTPYVVNIIGVGMQSTILQANAANIPIIKGGPYPTESLRDGFRGFSVKAHASGSTGPAIEMAGFRSSVFEDIEYLSNGAGNFNSFFHFSSHIDGGASHCYGNLVRHPIVHEQTGPTTVFLFDNDGTANPIYQANQNEIQDIWVNANSGITTVVDARRSAETKTSGGMAESNTGAVVLIPGTLTTFENVWMESNATVPVVPTTAADGTSNGVKFLNNYISSAFTLTLSASYSDWEVRGNYPAANLTVVDAGVNGILQYGGTFKGKLTFFARSATDFALRLVPFDDTSPTSAILSGTNAAQSVTTWAITQQGMFRSFVATGTAPLTVASTTKVTNLNADLLDGADWAAPAAIGSTTPAAGTFTKVTAAVNTVTFSATPTFNASLGNTQKITLTANVTSSTLSNATAGQTINFLICQDATGGRTFVWPTNVKGGMTIGSTLSTCSAQDFIFDGTNAYAVSPGEANQ
jgi:hypothetical protein